MKKIPTLFVRDMTTGLVTPKVTPGCEWVLSGEGMATRKYDGTCCLVIGGKLYKRHELRYSPLPNGSWLLPKFMPPEFQPADLIDPDTGKRPGWVPVGDGPEDRWHREGWEHFLTVDKEMVKWGDGTYELCGPKVQGNPEGFETHVLVPHPYETYIADPRPRTFESIRDWLRGMDVEGVVYHHPDGRMAKIKKKDFGMGRKP